MEMSTKHKKLTIIGYGAIAVGYAIVLYVIFKNLKTEKSK